MTLLQIDLSDALDEYHDDDSVVVWAPNHREGSRGQVVNTAQKRIRLTRGKAEQEVEPGPLVIRIQCRGISDTSPKDTVVPDQNSVTLRQLLEQGFTYTPPVVTAVQQARNQTMEYMERAEAGADRVGTAEQVGQWAAQAQEGADRVGSAERVLEAEGVAVDAASSASASEANASTSEQNAGVSEKNADESAAIATLAAAELGHLQGTGPPEGVVPAPVGAVYADTAATAGAVRWIKVEGTEAAGWRVLYGDTGWVVADGWAINGWSGRLRVRRIGGWVEVIVHALDPTAMTGNPSVLFPVGFRPYQSSGATVRPLLHESDNTSTPRRFYFTAAGELATTTYAKPVGPVYGSFAYTTTDPWLTA